MTAGEIIMVIIFLLFLAELTSLILTRKARS